MELKELNDYINLRIHDGDVPKTFDQKKFIILPHDKYNDARVQILKEIAMKVDLVFGVDDLVIKDEAEFSASSGSESGSPRK